MNWYAYYIHPIDFGWENLKTVSQTVSDLAKEDQYNDLNTEELQSFFQNWELAKESAIECGWEGDFRNPPCVFWLPGEESFKYAFVFKQENNGDTIVVSPYQLPWLNEITLSL